MSIKQWLKSEPFILAHHPACERFKDHIVKIRGVCICRGCLFVYSTAIVSLILFNLPGKPSLLPYWGYFVLSFLFFFFSVIRKFYPLKTNLGENISRIFLGLTLSLSITSAIKAPSFQIKITLIVIIIIVWSIYNGLNGMRTINICRKCPEYNTFPKCSGQI